MGRLRFGSGELPAESRLAELESTLTQLKLDPAENVPLLAPLFDIPVPQERKLTLAAEELRRRLLGALTNLVMASARTQPVVLVLEDVHWADPTTLDLLHGFAERGALAPLFVLVTARPEFRPPWLMRSHHSSISLAPLDPDQVRHMVGELAAHHALPTDVIDSVTVRTGGVPLFVEELTRLLLERGDRVGVKAVPPTLQQSLTARLDRLGPAREVAQIGSVIGRGFTYLMLRSVSAMEDALLQKALDRSLRRTYFWSRICLRNPTIASSTHLFRTQPTKAFLRAGVKPCIAEWLKHGALMRLSQRRSLSCWRITLLRPV